MRAAAVARFYVTADLVVATGYSKQQITWDVREDRVEAEKVGKGYVFTQAQYDAALEFYRRKRAAQETEHA